MATYCCSDLHGNYEVFKKIQEMLKPDDTMYFLGDAADRGPDGWRMIKEILKDNRWIYLKGNHEDMLIKAASAYLANDENWEYQSYCLCLHNGGEKTLFDWCNDEWRKEWLQCLKELPIHATYNSPLGVIRMSHAGYTPFHFIDYDDKPIETPQEWELLWDRSHFTEDWDNELAPNDYIIHGHTPYKYVAAAVGIDFRRDQDGPLWYCDNHKCCLDNWTAHTGRAVVLNLDTFEDCIVK